MAQALSADGTTPTLFAPVLNIGYRGAGAPGFGGSSTSEGQALYFAPGSKMVIGPVDSPTGNGTFNVPAQPSLDVSIPDPAAIAQAGVDAVSSPGSSLLFAVVAVGVVGGLLYWLYKRGK